MARSAGRPVDEGSAPVTDRGDMLPHGSSRAHRGSVRYPKRLEGLQASAIPSVIMQAGRPWAPEPLALAVVGSRRATESGRQWARALGRAMADAGIAIVSGGALGIDAAAHRGALDGGGRTCVVVPGTVEDPPPRTNRALFEAIIAGGGTLLSEHEEPPPGKLAFSSRNRLIAALSDAVLVVEASQASGTRYTVEVARRLGRPVFTKRWPSPDARNQGAESFAADSLGVSTVAEVVAWFDGPGAQSTPEARPPKPLPAEDVDPVWTALSQPMTFESLQARLGADAGQLSLLLANSELAGRVERVAGRWTRRYSA